MPTDIPKVVQPQALQQTLDVALAPNLSYLVEAPEGRHWLVRGAEEKQALVNRGCPRGRVWTLAELAGLPWGGPLTLARVVEAFQQPVKEPRFTL